MNSTLKLDTKDLESIKQEIQQLQNRVIQTLVPTILALGLIAIANPDYINLFTLGCTFSVLFSSSLYIACLSYKIFRNSQFLAVFYIVEREQGKVYWDDALFEYRRIKGIPFIIHSETTTAAFIYIVLAITFFCIFYNTNFLVSLLFTFALIFNSCIIFHTYYSRDENLKIWHDIKKKMESNITKI